MNSGNLDQPNAFGTIYICGSCGKEQEIKPNEPVLCTECSGRIFYKKRGNKASQYEAR